METDTQTNLIRSTASFTPIEVLQSATGEKRLLGKISGIATVELPDKVKGNIIDLDTIRLDYFLKSGPLTYEHPRGVFNIVGFPTAAEIIPYTTDDGRASRALKIDGCLYLDDEMGGAIYYKAVTMKEAGGQRSIAWSLEGPGVTLNADIEKPTRKVYHHEPKALAICLEPANEWSLWDVAASAQVAEMLSPTTQSAVRDYMLRASVGAKIVDPQRSAFRTDDRHVIGLLKSFPTLSWAQGEEFVGSIRAEVQKILKDKGSIV